MKEFKIGDRVRVVVEGTVVAPASDRQPHVVVRDAGDRRFYVSPDDIELVSPTEPLGIGAVVRTADSQVWTRIVAGPAEGMRPWQNAQGGSAPWATLVEYSPDILSQGLGHRP